MSSDVLPAVYDELRRLAAAKLAAEPAGHTLDATALVHEAYLKLAARGRFDSPTAFKRAAAVAMRHVLVDHARSRLADKRGGGRGRVPLDETVRGAESPADLLALNDALDRFAADEPRKAELVILRYFAGMTTPEAAEALGVSVATAERWWAFARTWLYAELADNP